MLERSIYDRTTLIIITSFFLTFLTTTKKKKEEKCGRCSWNAVEKIFQSRVPLRVRLFFLSVRFSPVQRDDVNTIVNIIRSRVTLLAHTAQPDATTTIHVRLYLRVNHSISVASRAKVSARRYPRVERFRVTFTTV